MIAQLLYMSQSISEKCFRSANWKRPRSTSLIRRKPPAAIIAFFSPDACNAPLLLSIVMFETLSTSGYHHAVAHHPPLDNRPYHKRGAFSVNIGHATL